MAKEKIVVVDDEEDIVELLRYNLCKEGYRVIAVHNGEDALAVIRKERPDLVILDLMLPGMSGLDVCKNLHREKNFAHIPILMLSARGEETDVVTGLELGAEDYVTKPFSPRVLVARVRKILERNSSVIPGGDEVLRIAGLLIHPGKHEVFINDEQLDLTSTEFKLLHFLARNRGWVYSRAQLVEAVHGDDYPVTDRSVDVQVVGLRKKLGKLGEQIETVRGVGYRFKA